MFASNKVKRFFTMGSGVLAVCGLLAAAPMAMAGEKAADGKRSYYFSRTAAPYEGYEAWLKDNPRFNHPYHDTVHGPLFSNKATTDPAVEDAKTRPYPNQPALRAERRIKPPYGYNRLLWVNDRYYSGKYYPTAKEKE